jgi:hypothetical protein
MDTNDWRFELASAGGGARENEESEEEDARSRLGGRKVPSGRGRANDILGIDPARECDTSGCGLKSNS